MMSSRPPEAKSQPRTRSRRPAVAEAVDRMVSVDGATLHVRTIGTGDPILLMNGLGAHTGMWTPLAARLSRHRQVIMFDAPGCGQSPVLRRPRRMSGLADLVAGLLDALGLDRVDVLGYSWGGVLAQQFTHDHQERVRRLILVATTPGLGGQAPSLKVMGLMTTPLRYFSPRFMTHAAPHLYGGHNRLPADQRPRTTDRWSHRPPNPIGYSHQLFAISAWSSLRWLKDISVPTLVISGDDDPLAPVRNAYRMAEELPNAELAVIAGAGHLWLIGRTQESNAVVEKFLGDAARTDQVSVARPA